MSDVLPVESPALDPSGGVPNPLPADDIIKATFDRIYGTYATYTKDIEVNRELRRSHSDVKTLRQQKKLRESDTYIAVRVIDENIERDKPTVLAYLKQSPRYAVFAPADGSVDPQVPTLEAFFTTLMRYDDPAWELDYISVIDGSLAHGIDYVEVLYDTARPGHVSVNHVGIDRIIHDLNYDDLQQSPLVARGYRLGPVEVERYMKSGLFKRDAAHKLLEQLKASAGSTTLLTTNEPTVYKLYFKHDGLVYFMWYSRSTAEFLTQAIPFYNGLQRKNTNPVIQPGQIEPTQAISFERIQETAYPFVGLRKKLTEDKQLAHISGHSKDAYYLQEAAASLTSALVNGTMEASNTMWAPSESSGLEGSAPTQLPNFTIAKNAVWARPMEAFHPPYPDPSLIQTLQYMETRNGIATNQPAFAVTNRKDARKTATEMQLAQQQTSQINSVQVLHLSIFIREVARRAWNIVQSEIITGALSLPAQVPMRLIEREYIISSAGDIDYVQRQELIAAFQQDWPILSTTPIGPLMLEDYVRARYQSYGVADRYIQALKTNQAEGPQLVQALSTVIQELATDDAGQLNAEAAPHANNLGLLQQRVAAYLQSNAAAMGGVAPQPANQAAPQQPA